MKLLVALVGLALLGALAGLGALVLGLPDVAATTPHWKLTEWALSTAMEHGVERRAAGIPVPEDLGDPVRIRAGASAYDEMCADCHAAPGIEPSVLARGLLPPPPRLADQAGAWSPAELFWIVKHGIRMTGMPAFGPTHADRALWDITAFLQQLPELSPAAYHALIEGAGHHHQHGDDHHPH